MRSSQMLELPVNESVYRLLHCGEEAIGPIRRNEPQDIIKVAPVCLALDQPRGVSIGPPRLQSSATTANCAAH